MGTRRAVAWLRSSRTFRSNAESQTASRTGVSRSKSEADRSVVREVAAEKDWPGPSGVVGSEPASLVAAVDDNPAKITRLLVTASNNLRDHRIPLPLRALPPRLVFRRPR